MSDVPEICNGYGGDLYFKPWARCSVYFMGYAFGAFVVTRQFESAKNQTSKNFGITLKSKISIFIYYLAWIAVFILANVIPFCLKDYWVNRNWSRFAQDFFNGFAREIWGLMIFLIIYLSEFIQPQNARTFINFPTWFLKHNFWSRFSKLNYSAYCGHYIVLCWVIGRAEETKFYTNKIVFLDFINVVVLSYVFAFVLYALFEAPFRRVELKFLRFD